MGGILRVRKLFAANFAEIGSNWHILNILLPIASTRLPCN
jgi:hypothetical protein